MGEMVPYLQQLANLLQTDFFTWDYKGYGASTGNPTEDNIKSDITTIFKHLKDHYSYSDSQIILYGQSIGTVPAIDLASTTPDLAALVLHSPLMSGLHFVREEPSKCLKFMWNP